MSKKVHTNIWSAYGFAQKAGYEGTEEEFEQGLKKSAEAAENAEESASTASEAATEANAARDAAAQSAENASTSEGNALEYANSAAQVLRDAQAVAQTVNAKANEAAGSASRAENYAQTATTKASNATAAAGTATAAASSASGSAQAADASATAAAASETNAAASASNAATSAGNASASADAAAESAEEARAVQESIPEDYSQLSADVTDLKSAISDIYDGYALRESLFEKGAIDNFANSTHRAACRCRTIKILNYPFDITLTIVLNETIVRVFYYDAEGVGIEEILLQDNQTKSIAIPKGTNFRFFVDGKRGGNATELTITEILAHISVTAGYDSILLLTGKVSMLAEEIDDIAKVNKYGVPDYYFDNDYLPNKAVSAQMASNVNGISFGFVTDMHTGNSSRNSMRVAKYIADNTSAIPFMICGGDIPETNTGTEAGLHEQAMMWQDMMSQFGKHKVYTCRGNHDYLSKMSDNTSYNTSHGTCHSYVMGYMPDNVVASGDMKMSYYVDFDTVKTRLIVLDEYDVSDSGDFTGYVGLSPAQLNWFAEDALNANGYNIIIVVHQPINPTDYETSSALTFLKNVITAFNNHAAFSGSYGATTLNVDFSTYTSNLLFVLSGHSHKDYSYSDGFLTIGTTCDAIYDTDGYNRALGQINEIAFDIISVDFDNREIKCTRVGAGNDRTFTY